MHKKPKKDYSNLIGKVYPNTKWIVNNTVFHKKETHAQVTCICGNKGLVKLRSLKTGRTKSCGKCSPRNIAKKLGNKTYQSNYPCPKGHTGLRRTDSGACVECAYEHKRQKRKDPEYWRYECDLAISYYKEKRKDPEWIKEYNNKRKEEYREKIKNDPEYRDKLSRNSLEYYHFRRKNQEGFIENLNKKRKDYFNNTEIGQLRRFCNNAARQLSLGKMPKSKIDVLDYTAAEFITHLLKDYNFNTLAEAHKAGLQKDHICPIAHIVKHIENKVLKFKIAMDLKNIRLFPRRQNIKKHAKIDLPEVQEMIKYLNQKYNVNMPLK